MERGMSTPRHDQEKMAKKKSSSAQWCQDLCMIATTTTTAASLGGGSGFAVISWNLLAESYLSRTSHPHLPHEYQEVVFCPQRRRLVLVERLQQLAALADILCLQEVDLYDLVTQTLEPLGFEGRMARPEEEPEAEKLSVVSNNNTTSDEDEEDNEQDQDDGGDVDDDIQGERETKKGDGKGTKASRRGRKRRKPVTCAIFWRRDKLELMDSMVVNFDDLAKAPSSCSLAEQPQTVTNKRKNKRLLRERAKQEHSEDTIPKVQRKEEKQVEPKDVNDTGTECEEEEATVTAATTVDQEEMKATEDQDTDGNEDISQLDDCGVKEASEPELEAIGDQEPSLSECAAEEDSTSSVPDGKETHNNENEKERKNHATMEKPESREGLQEEASQDMAEEKERQELQLRRWTRELRQRRKQQKRAEKNRQNLIQKGIHSSFTLTTKKDNDDGGGNDEEKRDASQNKQRRKEEEEEPKASSPKKPSSSPRKEKASSLSAPRGSMSQAEDAVTTSSSDSSSSFPLLSTAMLSSYQRRNSAISVLLKPCHPAVSASSPPLLCVANAHLFWNPEYEYVKLSQAKYLVNRLEQWILPPKKVAVMLCGDFNSKPSSPVYNFLRQGHYDARRVAPWTYHYDDDDDDHDEGDKGAEDSHSEKLDKGSAILQHKEQETPKTEGAGASAPLVIVDRTLLEPTRDVEGQKVFFYPGTGSEARCTNPHWIRARPDTFGIPEHLPPSARSCRRTPQVRFLLDYTLNRFTRWLRILGMDAVLETGAEEKLRTSHGQMILFDRCREERRTLLTTSARLILRKDCPPGSFLVNPRTPHDLEQSLVQILQLYGMVLQPRKFLTRCVVCNGHIVTVEGEEERRLVFAENHAKEELALSQSSHNLDVYRCDGCGQGYWWDDRPTSSASRVKSQATRLFTVCLRAGIPIEGPLRFFDFVNIEAERRRNHEHEEEEGVQQQQQQVVVKNKEAETKLEDPQDGSFGGIIEAVSWLKQEHLACPFTLRSAYSHDANDPAGQLAKSDAPAAAQECIPFSNVTSGFIGLLDYVLYEPSLLAQTGRLYVPTTLRELAGPRQLDGGHVLPSDIWPSDHLAVGGTFVLRNSNDEEDATPTSTAKDEKVSLENEWGTQKEKKKEKSGATIAPFHKARPLEQATGEEQEKEMGETVAALDKDDAEMNGKLQKEEKAITTETMTTSTTSELQKKDAHQDVTIPLATACGAGAPPPPPLGILTKKTGAPRSSQSASSVPLAMLCGTSAPPPQLPPKHATEEHSEKDEDVTIPMAMACGTGAPPPPPMGMLAKKTPAPASSQSASSVPPPPPTPTPPLVPNHNARCDCGCVPNVPSMFEMAELRRQARLRRQAQGKT